MCIIWALRRDGAVVGVVGRENDPTAPDEKSCFCRYDDDGRCAGVALECRRCV